MLSWWWKVVVVAASVKVKVMAVVAVVNFSLHGDAVTGCNLVLKEEL